MRKILIVEDDILAAELERDYLEASDYEVELCADGEEGYKKALSGDYDLLLLDIMLPGMSGFEICRRIRREQNIPIVMVTAKTEDVDMIRGLGLGADDYIMKPFNPAELVARVKAHIRIHETLLGQGGEEDREIRYRDLVISVPYRRVTVRGKEVNLKNREYELLYFLASHQGMVFSRDTLLERIWGQDTSGDTATVMVHIGRIREKIEENPQKPEYIITVWGAGYKFADKQ
ncbi:MAG: response regulator transcription factor [Lachnospiraceae bacterium]|nr:response regulator transcription factor [Lachnospiraceae bacterium]